MLESSYWATRNYKNSLTPRSLLPVESHITSSSALPPPLCGKLSAHILVGLHSLGLNVLTQLLAPLVRLALGMKDQGTDYFFIDNILVQSLNLNHRTI